MYNNHVIGGRCLKGWGFVSPSLPILAITFMMISQLVSPVRAEVAVQANSVTHSSHWYVGSAEVL